MKKESFHFPVKLIDELALKCKGIIDENSFNKIVKILENEASKYFFDSLAVGNFYRVINSIFDVSTFLKELINFPHHAEILTAIVSSSNYLTDIVVQNPEYLYQVFDGDYLKKVLSKKELEIELTNSISKFRNFETKIKLIRQFKKRYILKIGLQDILHLHNLRTITFQLSILAKVILSILFELCYNEVLSKYNLKKPKNKFSICALGKLGGDELNYSSDVDLIIFYDKNSPIKNLSKDYHELLTEVIQLFTKVATQLTANGFIYRIDFRLRPDGKYSPLCKELNDYIKYYETRGEDWEKQMLIKLSYVGGDINLYNQFNSFVNSFVYHSIITDSIKEKIKQMKINIEKNNLYDDIKTFVGGIRDIEFSVQALQLLNGNKIQDLKTGNTLTALEILYKNKLLTKKEYEKFSYSYIFYRNIEHFLQLMNDTQTHRLPEDNDTLERLVHYLNIENVEKLKTKIESKRNEVRKIYNSILQTDKENILTKTKFIDKQKAEANISFLKNGKGIVGRKEFDTQTISTFEKIEIYLYKYLLKCENPDYVLENLTKFIKFSLYPSIWYNEFRNEKFFQQFLNICQFSERAIYLLINSKQCREILLSRKVFIKNFNDEFQHISTEEMIFILSVQYSFKLINAQKFSNTLYDFVVYKINYEFNRRFNNVNIFIAALGSTGSKSITFSSDIDLLVVIDKLKEDSTIEKDFKEFISNIKQILYPFDIDFRLRPEGKKAQLVWDLENYKLYLENRAKVWEFQSLTKINLIAGNNKLYNQFFELIKTTIKKFSNEEIKNEIKSMYFKLINNSKEKSIKNIQGGLTTIDFIFQYILLTESAFYFNKSYFTALNYLSLKNTDLKKLLSNFFLLKEIELTYQNMYNVNKSFDINDNIRKKYIAKFLKYENDFYFDKQLNEILNTNIKLFNKYLD